MTETPPEIGKLFDLSERVALVTGGARGLGWEIARALLEAGAAVVLTSRDAQRAETAARELAESTKGSTLGLPLDVADEEAVIGVFRQVNERYNRLDILINNAGGAASSEHYHLWQRPLADWNAVIATNLTGTFLCTREAAGLMMPRRSGSIVNIASIAGLVGRDRRMYEGIDMHPTVVDYAAAKAGVLGLTRDAAAELAPYGIRVNAISPGGIERGQDPEFIRRYSEATALKRMGRDGFDIRGAALFLASNAADYITGENLVVDGGFVTYK